MAAQMWHQINSSIGRPAHPTYSDDLTSPLDSINDFFQNVAITDHHKSTGHFNVPTVSPSNAYQFWELSVDVALSHLTSLDTSK